MPPATLSLFRLGLVSDCANARSTGRLGRLEPIDRFARAAGIGASLSPEQVPGEETAGRHGHDGAARWSYGDLRAAGNRLRRGRGDRQMGSPAG